MDSKRGIQIWTQLIFLLAVALVHTERNPCHAIEITPANPVPLHSLVRIKYDAGQGINILKQDFTTVDFIDCGNGSAAFTGPSGRYAVLVSSAGKLDIAIVQIGDVSPPVPPGPDPVPPGPDPVPPGPVPPPPEPLSPAAQSVRDEVRKLSAADRQIALPQAQVWEGSAAQIAAGVDQTTVWKATREALRALFVDVNLGKRWNPVSTRINAILVEQRNRDPSPGNMAQTLREIARGLKAGAV